MAESDEPTNPEPKKASGEKKPVGLDGSKRNTVNPDAEHADADAAAGANSKPADRRTPEKTRNGQQNPAQPVAAPERKTGSKSKSQKSSSGIIRTVDRVAVFLAKAAAFGLVAGAVGVATAYVLRDYSANTSNEPDPIAAATERIDSLQSDIAGLKEEIQRLAVISENNQKLQTAVAELSQNSDLQSASLEALRAELASLSETGRLADASTDERLGGLGQRLTELESLVSSFGKRVLALEESYGGLSQAAVAAGGNESASTSGGQNVAGLETAPPAPVIGTSGADAGPMSKDVERLDGEIAELNARLNALAESKAEASRYDEMEQRLEGLTASVQAIRDASADVQLPPELEGRIEALAAQVESIAADLSTAGSAQSRSIAMIGVRAAAETGAPYGLLLLEAGFEEADLPEIVRAHQEVGIATISELRESFPEASRAAVRAAEMAPGPDGVAGGIGSLLRSIFQVRPLTPIEGDDPPALLSRAEALVRANQLRDAIEVLDALPEAGRLAMEAWLDRANARLNVLEALDGMASLASEG